MGCQRGILGDQLAKLPPGPLPQQFFASRVEHLEGWVEPRFDRSLPQQPAAEGVDRADHGRVDLGEGLGQPFPFRRRQAGIGDRPLQPLTEPAGQLGGRLLGEGNGNKLADRGGSRLHE